MTKLKDMRSDLASLEYGDAWSNEEIQKIIHSASRKYSAYVDVDDLQSLQMETLWKCLKKYDSTSNMSFTTYLYTQIVYTILNVLHKNRKRPSHVSIELFGYSRFSPGYQEKIDIDNIMFDLNDTDRNIIHQRFFENMTFEEIAKLNHVSKETARRKVKNILKKTRKTV